MREKVVSGFILALDGGELTCFCLGCVLLVLFFVVLIRYIVKFNDAFSSAGVTNRQSNRFRSKQKEAVSKYGEPADESRLYSLLPELKELGSQWEPTYEVGRIPKRTGGYRELQIPDQTTKKIQHALYYKLFAYYGVHPSACGFVKGKSIVDNAKEHVGQEVVIKLDIQEFFPNTSRLRINRYFCSTGWTPPTADLLTNLVCYGQGLPQGAPTSPVLSNIINKSMDRRLLELSRQFDANYTRYADDLTFSMAEYDRRSLHLLLQRVGAILRIYGYKLNQKKKRIIRQHRRQEVTGLVVNSKVNLSRHRRRWLRSIQHRIKQGEKLTITMAEYQGWIALVQMVDPASKLVHFHREFVAPRTSDSKTSGSPGTPKINAGAAQEPETISTSGNEESPHPGVKIGDDGDEHRSVNQEQPSQADGSGGRSEMAADTGNITQETSGVENDQNGSSQQDELESLSVDADVFHEDRLEDQVQALKAAKPYSPEAKQLQNDFISSIHTIRIQLESSKRTFSFRLPEGYQKGRTIMGTLADGTSVELYFHDSLVEIIEEAEFPLEGEINIEVVQWNATFKRVEAIVTGGLFH